MLLARRCRRLNSDFDGLGCMTARFRKVLLPVLLFALLFSPVLAHATERVLSFHSDITVQDNGVLQVVETIRVNAEGRVIRRGITRDFPTTYKTDDGRTARVTFKVLDVQRDDQPESYHTKAIANGQRVYVGSSGVFLQPGEYSYRLTYETDGQLGFFDDHDELYWNVTGNGWAFPIERASAEVRLPTGIPADAINTRFLTGRFGSSAADGAASVDSITGKVSFSSNRALQPGEGLTIVVGWPKGFVSEPSALQQLKRSQPALIPGLLSVFGIFLYYYLIWHKVGKDPEPGTIIPLFEPPERLSPAAARYVSEMGFDEKAFTAALVSLAVKGFLSIAESGKKEYTVVKTESPSAAPLSKGEKALYAELFSGGDMLALKKKNHSILSRANRALKRALASEYKNAMFRSNIAWVVVGALLTIFAIILVLALSGISSEAILTIAPLSPWVVIIMARWLSLGSSKASRTILAVVLVIVLGFGVVGGSLVSEVGGRDLFVVIAVVATLIALNAMFYFWLKAPTSLGRGFLDKLEGFKQFLSVAEKDRLNSMHPPKKTPELFEKYLPWALALEVDQQWMEQFSGVLSAASAEQQGGYHPVWYSGRSFNDFGRGGFAGALSSGLTSAIASASTAPGSSSGFSSGGGFSGGGGGGGGGGGW